jgi:hypothetical protein
VEDADVEARGTTSYSLFLSPVTYSHLLIHFIIFQLVLNNNPETIIAKFHREHSGALGLRDKVQASLEISIFTTSNEPTGMEEALLDMILVTFVYVETIRAAREEATATVAGEVGGAVGGAA